MTILLVGIGVGLLAALAIADHQPRLAFSLAVVALLCIAEWHLRGHGRGKPGPPPGAT